jgi:hypothetical protein
MNADLFEGLFVSINQYSGHEQDMRRTLTQALSGETQYSIFQDIQKEPAHTFYLTVRAILLSKGVLLDASPIPGESTILDPDILIQFGIAFGLGKEILLVAIQEGSPAQASMTDGYLSSFPSYAALATNLDTKAIRWNQETRNRRAEREVKYEPRNIMSFSVFGATEDIRKAINSFVGSSGWRPRYSRQIDSSFKLQTLAKEIGERAFCLFCLNSKNDEETFVSIGLAIGMGVPFIIVLQRPSPLPETLKGYHAIIEYEQYIELERQLSAYAQNFLRPEITRWSGSTFRHLSSWADDLVKGAKEDDLNEAERLFNAIIASVDNPIAEPHEGLGDTALTRYYRFRPKDVSLLHIAKAQYERALEIDPEFVRCKNGIVVIERQVELLELLREGQYKSIPSLIHLIGEDLTSEQYAQMRIFFFDVIKQLVANKDYVNALALLSAMRVHDKSKEIDDLIQSVFELAPTASKEAFLDAQDYITKLEIKEKDLIQENENLKANILRMKQQLEVIRQNSERLERLKAEMEAKAESSVSLAELETQSRLGKAVLVDFGVGWALYVSLGGKPYIVRDMEQLEAGEGLLLNYGDYVIHSGGKILVRL